jgi:hypothetical protein
MSSERSMNRNLRYGEIRSNVGTRRRQNLLLECGAVAQERAPSSCNWPSLDNSSATLALSPPLPVAFTRDIRGLGPRVQSTAPIPDSRRMVRTVW